MEFDSVENDRYSNAPHYSERGRYGDTTQRCAWCGKPTDYGDRCCVGGVFRRNYCSFTCRAAGDYYPFIVIAVFFSIIATFSIWSYQPSPTSLFILIYLVGLPALCLWSCVCCGKSERKGSEQSKLPPRVS